MTQLECLFDAKTCYLDRSCRLKAINLSTSEKKIHQWEASAETVTPELVEEFFDYFTRGDKEGGDDKTLCNFYGSTEMMDVTFAAFRSAEDAKELVIDGKVSRSPIGFKYA